MLFRGLNYMSEVISVLEWDSLFFGGRTGIVTDCCRVPGYVELTRYKFVHVRIPQDKSELVWKYQGIGFRYITVDYVLEKALFDEPKTVKHGGAYTLYFLHREQPFFLIKGFDVSGSRMLIDPELSQHIDENFWDERIKEHCNEFADFVLCAVNNENKLIGFISCFEKQESINMFLVVVHPMFKRIGIGKTLIKALELFAYKAGKKLTTSVVSNNLDAMNFYFLQGFVVVQAYIVMHFSRELKCKDVVI